MRRPSGFRLPRHLRTDYRLGGPPEKADLVLGSGSARFWVPREKGQTEDERRQPMSTFMSRKQGVTQRPPLRRMLSEKDIRTYHRY